MKKRLFAALLCVLMVTALLPATAFAEESGTFYVQSTDATPENVKVMILKDPDGDTPGTVQVGDGTYPVSGSATAVTLPEVVTRPDTGDDYRVTAVAANAFDGHADLQSVSLPGVTNIGNGAFHMCTLLESVNLPSVTTIGDNAFVSCRALQSVNLPNVQTIGNYAFAGCSVLESVTLPNVETIGSNAFKTCSSLTTLNLPKVQTIGDDAFNGCTSLQSVTIWQTSAPHLGDPTVFEGVPTTCKLYIPNGSSSKYTDSAGWPTTKVELWPVTGTVYDANGTPAANATVSVYGISTRTDLSGAYTVYVRPNESTPAVITAKIEGADEKIITVSNVTGALTDKDFYYGKAAAPTFTPAAGTYNGTKSVTIAAVDGADIYYTTDGNEPTKISDKYTAAISVSSSTTLKAKAFKTGLAESDTATAAYTITNNATSVWIAGRELTSANPYYHNGPNGVPGTANNTAANYNAYFNAAAGTLTLKGLSVQNSTVTKEMSLGGTPAEPVYAVYAEGDLTICVDGSNSVSVAHVQKTDANAFSLALYVTGKLTVQPGDTGSGTLTAKSKGATSTGTDLDSSRTAMCSGVICRTLEVKSGATLEGLVSGNSTGASAYSFGVNLDSVTVTGGTLKGIVSGTLDCKNGTSDCGISCGIMVNNGNLSLSAGSVEATGGNVPRSTSGRSIGVAMMGTDAPEINITGGSFTAKSGTTVVAGAGAAAVQNPLTLGSGVTAKGSTSSDGSNPDNYEVASNSSYKWVQAKKLNPTLTVAASPSGSVAIGSAVTLTATAIDIEDPVYKWYSNATNSKEGANEIDGATATTYTPPTNTAGTMYYYCVVPDVPTSNIVGVTVNQPSAGGGDYTPSPVTVYNDPSVPNATVWLTGSGLGSSDRLITERDPQGSAYKALMKLADSDDVFATYNIYLRSGKKGTGFAMNLTFDLNAKYAGNDFTLVHQKADSTFEYFYDAADANGDLTFGPLYELSPFMLVKGRLAQTAFTGLTDAPKTGDNAQIGLWAGIALLACAGLAASLVFAQKRRQNG